MGDSFSIGDKVGTWTLIRHHTGQRSFIGRCDCGRERVFYGTQLRRETSLQCRSCASMKHGGCKGYVVTPEYQAWADMIKRCENPKHQHYRHYGGRVITVCQRWRKSFADFLSDMGSRPSPELSLDREDNDGNYEPENCRWATKRQQVLNRRKWKSRV